MIRCNMCGYKATISKHLVRHKNLVHKSARYLCCFCEFKASVKGHLKTHVYVLYKEKRFHYEVCNKDIISEHLDVTYKCDVCNFILKNINAKCVIRTQQH